MGFTNATLKDNAGVFGSSHGGASAVYGQNISSGYGVRGESNSGDAIHGESGGTAVYGQSSGSVGVLGYTTATGTQNAGVKGLSQSDAQGVIGEGRSSGSGVYGTNSGSGYGVTGISSNSALAGGRFVSSATNGVALVAESPSGAQIMRADTSGVHAGPGMTTTPLAYGVVEAAGACIHKSPNVSCTPSTTGYYYITIAGEDYDPARHITIVTPYINEYQISASIDRIGSPGQGQLAVKLVAGNGAPVSSRFYFVTFKP